MKRGGGSFEHDSGINVTKGSRRPLAHTYVFSARKEYVLERGTKSKMKARVHATAVERHT